ncbi:hypothetical protein DV737_g1595, partial [Chaetothyriales sp. CBS 132003]
MVSSTYIAGVGMTPFNSPKKSAAQSRDPGSDYFDLGVEAGVKALLDAGITYDEVDQGIGCYVFGDSTCAQRVFYGLGMTSIPIFNVNNYCSSGSTGLWLANQAVKSGSADCVLVIGFDKMYPGALPQIFKDRTNPLSRILDLSKTQIPEQDRNKPSPGWTPQLYANAQHEYLTKYGPNGAQRKHFAQITATGAAAAVVVSEAFLASHPYLQGSAIEIAGQSLATDSCKLYSSAIELIGSDMTRKAAASAFTMANIGPRDVSVIELHDCFTTNQMCALEGLGLAEEGQGWKLVEDGGITYRKNDGAGTPTQGWIVNPSGGLISKGHPLGATGLAQCAELVWHLRGWATSRQVPGTKYCLQHNMGLGGATVVTIYKRADGKQAPEPTEIRPEDDGRGRLGYNPAEEARSIRREDWEATKAHGQGSSEWATKLLPWNQVPEAFAQRARL